MIERQSAAKEIVVTPKGEERSVRRRWLRFKNRGHLPHFLYTIFGFAVWLFGLTLRVDKVKGKEKEAADGSKRPVIYVVWHNRLLFIPLMFSRRARRRIAILASDSRDGEHAARYMRFFGLHPVRGSSSKGGARALRLLKKQLENGFSVAVTPDGPRGPCYKVQPGVVALAQITGCPIVPISLNAFRKWQLPNWDRAQIPKPLSRVEFVVGQDIQVPRDATADQRPLWQDTVGEGLMRITVD